MFYRSGGWYYCEACKPPDPLAVRLTDLGVQQAPVFCAGCTSLLPARLHRLADLRAAVFAPAAWAQVVRMYGLERDPPEQVSPPTLAWDDE